jgi:DNA (cytosine-5)-methyltransferase 1
VASSAASLLSSIDLFAGCGGLSLGFESAGFEPVYVNELNPDALNTYLVNRRDQHEKLVDARFHSNDIKELVNGNGAIPTLVKNLRTEFKINSDKGQLDAIVGGPPCQGYSGIGHRRSYAVNKSAIPSNRLYMDMKSLIDEIRPKLFLFENVKGLLSARWTDGSDKGAIWNDVLKTFESLTEYVVKPTLVLAKNYGVPQNRPRVLIAGIRKDVMPSWVDSSAEDAIEAGMLPEPSYGWPDLKDVLDDLVDLTYENGGETLRYPSPASSETQRELRKSKSGEKVARKGQMVTEHKYSMHTERVRRKFEHMLANDGEIPTQYQTKKFAQRLLPALWAENGPTITAASLPDDYVHYSQPRTLTVREWARLQGFPDWYEFMGKRTTGGLRRAGNPKEGQFDREAPKYTQIGNAVPVPLAQAVGDHFVKILNN